MTCTHPLADLELARGTDTDAVDCRRCGARLAEVDSRGNLRAPIAPGVLLDDDWTDPRLEGHYLQSPNLRRAAYIAGIFLTVSAAVCLMYDEGGRQSQPGPLFVVAMGLIACAGWLVSKVNPK